MRKIGLILPLMLVLLLLVQVQPVFSQQTGGQTVPLAKRVVLLSIDALRADMLWDMLLNRSVFATELPGFRFIYSNGVLARGMVVSFPSSTAVSHAVISTGAPPGVTGITGNAIHLPGTPLTSVVSGFNGSLLLAEPIWVTVDRQGLKAVVAGFPQSDPWAWQDKLRNSIVFNPYDSSMGPPTFSTLYTNNRSIPAATYIDIKPASNWTGTLPTPLITVYNAWEASFPFGDETWYFYIVDTTGDSYPDLVAIVPRAKNLSNTLAVLTEGQWSIPLNTTLVYKGVTYVIAPLFKALNLSLSNFKIYRSLTRPFESSTAWFSSRDVAWRVWNSVVARVGMVTDGDYYGLVNGWFDEETYMETVRLANTFFMEFTKWLIRNTDWNLLMTYTPIVDNVYHQFLGLTDPRMPYYDPVESVKYVNYIKQTIKWADEFVQMILSEVNLADTAVLVVSDHGQWPVAKLVYVNNILENAGLLKRSGGTILLNETIAWYNGYNQVFINLKGREAGGIVDPSEYDSVVNKVMSVLASVRDPDTQEPVFSVIMKKSEAAAFGLWGDRVGDIVISVKPGYAPLGGFSPTGSPFVNATPLKTITGNHQDLPYYPELYAVFAAVGSGIDHGVLGLIQSTSIAPTIARLLGVEPPLNSTGTVLPIFKPATVYMPTVIREEHYYFSIVNNTFTYTVLTQTSTLYETTTVTSTITSTITQTTTQTSTITTPITVTEKYTDPLYVASILVVALVGYAVIIWLKRSR
ncbi:alkaline phosphatase family protein [Thermogladius sp. 4427co]|uniref:alkaline phosphatase family protein n=1 Tax=Thermogladius sp. 4427co TaxID=3450718 RepID=UPI003F793F3F